nr:MAG TPA: hypothetical protein [Caudoviricetes sp.]
MVLKAKETVLCKVKGVIKWTSRKNLSHFFSQ